MGGEVRYCTTEDGVRIAYKVEGEGPPLIALSSFVEAYCSIEHLIPDTIETVRRIAGGRQLVFIDTRGTGLSDRDVTDMSPPALRRDIEAVVRELGFEQVSLWGSVVGGVRALDYAQQHPLCVDRLVLHVSFARIRDVFPADILQGLARLARANWDLAARTFADLGARPESDEYGVRLAESFKQSTNGETAARLVEANADVDLTPFLSKVSAETLIVHPVNHHVYTLALAQGLAAAIPKARLMTLDESRMAAISLPEDILIAVNAFLNEGLETTLAPSPAAAIEQGAIRTVLFTDLAGSTEMMSRLGDQRGRDVLREHERFTRDVLKAYDGAEIKTMGDGFMASFASVTKAVECAIALQRAFDQRNDGADEPLSVRVGLNAGEPIEEESDLFGATVILAARVAANARGGEILVSDVVRGLCSGKGFLFADCGEHALRGFEDPVRIFEVAWRQ